jgi:adenosylmethionine-8-amino-7-oxononanoate aminotransferase
MMVPSGLVEKDQKVIWHPYTQHALDREALPIASAAGAYLKLEDGSNVVDGISSWWVNLHGHCHSEIVKAITEQSEKMDHIIFAGFTHAPAVELAQLLLEGANRSGGLFARAFFSDNGSTAVEVALKMSFQFHRNRGEKGRNRFLALKQSYHGDTFGAMAVGEPAGFHTQFRKLLASVDFVEPGDSKALQLMLDEHGSEYAAFIFEPLIQAAAGMKTYDSEFLREAVKGCREKGIVTIADEVFTGFYRTGFVFASQKAEVDPDLMCLSKGISGGFLPLAVTLTTEEIYAAFLSSEIRSAFLHGHSYTANPIACAAAISSWHILHSEKTQQRIAAISKKTQDRITGIGAVSKRVKDSRNLGTIGVIELANDRTYFNSSGRSIFKWALSKGVFLRPLGNVIYAVPPYCCTDDEIDLIYDVIEEVVYEF